MPIYRFRRLRVFNTSHDEQQAMQRKLQKAAALFSSGHAGLASNFMDLGHHKLKGGGVLALFAFVRGKAWRRAREALNAHYTDIHVTSIAATGSTARAFSADTGMAECLVVATKRGGGHSRAAFLNLAARPFSLLEAAIEAKSARARTVQGDILDAGAAGIRSTSVILTASDLEAGNLCLPRQGQAIRLPMVTLGTVAARGLVDRDINGGPTDRNKTGQPQGPFVVRSISPGEVPTYPMLWAHSADRERKFVVLPDSCGDPRPDDESRAAERWNRAASRLHAQPGLPAELPEPCHVPHAGEVPRGATAWPNINSRDERYEIPLLLWANSTLGLILFWWKGTRAEQAGRSRMTITAIPDLPVLDPRTLTDGQTDHCLAILDDLKDCEFLPANEAWRDETRKALDRELLFGITSVLKLDPGLEEGLDLLRKQWCAEPSVHGGKGTRIDVP